MVGKMVTVRIQSRDGTKRIELSQKDNTNTLYQKAQECFGYSSGKFTLYKDRQKKEGIALSKTKGVQNVGINHGDILYLTPHPGVSLESNNAVTSPTNNFTDEIPGPSTAARTPTAGPSNSATAVAIKKANIVEDEVDVLLATQPGLIERPKDEKMCQHDSNGRCVFCAPLEPYDQAYLLSQNIKHMSFHSYLRKLTSGVDKGKFVALEDLNVSIKEGCQTHPPWPRGICSKCQPSAVTLNRQTYRHVDNVEFENPHIVERFLAFWRTSGCQRAGFLYGNYEQHTDVPLGIKARVAAIYEPTQDDKRDCILGIAQGDDKWNVVNEVAGALGLKCVGWIFTDLLPEDTSKGTVKHLRGIDTFFLTAEECCTAATYQNMNPNATKLAPTGVFGSKFATVLVTGDDKNQVSMVGYQVSNQCMSLVREDCLVPTQDAPELGYVRESTEKKYVPDVYYKEKDEYGNEVTRLGRPLPVEYLLVDVPVATPIEPKFTFPIRQGINPFPIENRNSIGQIQDFSALGNYLNQFPRNTPFLQIASDFHFLIYIATNEIVHIRDYIGPLLEAIREGDNEKASDWARSEHWATVEQLIEASSFTPGHPTSNSLSHLENMVSSPGSAVMSPQESWTCTQCTFINNTSSTQCEVCHFRR